VFVAASINLERILALPGIPERALETLAMLLSVTVVSLIGLLPGLGTTALGLLLLGQSLAWIAFLVPVVRKSFGRREGRRSWYVGRLVLVSASTLPYLIAAISVLAESGGGLYWTAAGLVFSILGGVTNAWVLLVEILR